MTRIYHYVGSHKLLELLKQHNLRVQIKQPDDVRTWTQTSREPRNPNDTLTATFIIDTDGQLWINERRSEHVVCANGQSVLSAGEMTFAVYPKDVEVTEVTNQSTGYCPEPDSWAAVASALDKVGIPHPGQFTTAYLFRRCEACGTTNIVKDDWFVCGVCDAELSRDWNFAV